jgi:hypothetical protein
MRTQQAAAIDQLCNDNAKSRQENDPDRPAPSQEVDGRERKHKHSPKHQIHATDTAPPFVELSSPGGYDFFVERGAYVIQGPNYIWTQQWG